MSSLVLAKFMTILLVLAHASMLLNSVSKSVSESAGTKRLESSANLINSLMPERNTQTLNLCAARRGVAMQSA